MTLPAPNQFALNTVQGQLDLEIPGTVVSVMVSASQGSALVPGQAVKMEDSTGGIPKILTCTANNDPVLGFYIRNLKDVGPGAGAMVEVAMKNSVMYMTANAAIARGAPVEFDYETNTVIQSAGVNTVIGWAYDKASNAGDLIRVYIDPPAGNVSTAAKAVTVTATLAQINAGQVLIPGKAGAAITVLNIVERVTGNFATGTSIIVESTNGTPVVVETIAEAALTNGAVITPNSANVTLGAGFAAPLGVGDGLKVVNSGSAQTGGTSITFVIQYQQD